MLFSVIYSCDAPMSERIGRYWPQHRRRWVLTENSNGQPNDWNGEWKCRHRKWCGIRQRNLVNNPEKDIVTVVDLYFAENWG